jgi:uncharacterized membrane protein YhiD involved in acid resistance
MEPNLMSGSLAVLSVTFNLALGLVLGASIGLERQWRQRHAGLATHALVAVGAAAFTSVPGLLPSVGDATRLGARSSQVEVTVYTARQEDTLVERLVGELSLLPHIHATGWTSTAPPE